MRRPIAALLLALAHAGMATAQQAEEPAAAAGPTARPVYAPGDRPAEILGRFAAFVTAMAAADSFSGAVAIAHAGKIVWSHASGIADERTRMPITADTRFTLASTGKMFTAIAIAQLMEQGRLRLDDTVGRHLPDFPNRDVARRVTIAQLLSHTSGLASYWNDLYAARRTSLLTVADHIPLFAGDSLLFAPGARWEYSNSGYIVLGRIIEVVSGLSYDEYLRRHVFGPAGMRNTGWYDRTGNTPNGAVGYFRSDSAGAPVSDNLSLRELRGSAAGGGYSTVADMVAFLDALAKDRLVKGSTRELFTSGKVDGPFGPKRYGYGFIVRAARDTVSAYGHTGGFPGITTQAFHYPDGDWTLVVLLNRSGPAMGPIMGEASRAVARLSATARMPQGAR